MLRQKFCFALFAGALAALAGASLAQEKAKTDGNGDPLPSGAFARMGTLRWRHADTLTFVTYTPDGKAVLTAGQDNLIKLWERETGKEKRRFEVKGAAAAPVGRPGGMVIWGGYGGRTAKVAMSEDGKIVAAVRPDNAIQLWDLATGMELRQLKVPGVGVSAILFAPDGKSLAARASDRSTYLLDADSGKVLHQIKPNPPKGGAGAVFIGGGIGEAGGLAFSRDSKTLATAELEFAMKITTYVRFTDTQTGNEIRKIDTSPNGVAAIAFSPDGKAFAYASGNILHLREADGVKEINQIQMPINASSLAFAPDSKTLAAKGRDQAIRLFEPNTGKTMHTLADANNAQPNVNVGFGGFGAADPNDIAFSTDGKVLAAAAGPTLRFWTVQTGKEQPIAGGHRGAVSTVALSVDGRTLFSRGMDGTVRRWDAGTGKELGQFTEPKATIAMAFSPDGKTAAFANQDGSIRLHTTSDGNEIHSLKGHQNGTAGLTFSADSKKFASRGAADRTIRIYDVAKGTELKEMNLPGPAPMAGGGFGGAGAATGQGLAFSADGQTIVANVNLQTFNRGAGQPQVAVSSTLYFFDVGTAKEIRKVALPDGRAPGTLVFSPDGRLLAAENVDHTVSLLEIASGKERALLGQPVAGAAGLPFAGGGVIVVAGGRGFVGGVKIYSTLAFSPDGGLLVTRGPEHALRVWDVDHAKQVGLFKGHAGEIQSVSISADRKTVATGSADTTALMWDLTGVKREPKAAAVALDVKQIEPLWADLIGGDAVQANKSRLKLAAAAETFVPFLREKIKPAATFDPKKIEGWITDLDSTNFQKRTLATSELEKLGELAVPALKKALDSNPTAEKRRRIEPLVEKAVSGDLNDEQMRQVRAMEVLERIGTAEARQLLDSLAQGAPGAFTTRQALHALANLDRRAK